ncbi:MAG: alpha/beta fold hydrolase [Acidobacteriaceae bacterium]
MTLATWMMENIKPSVIRSDWAEVDGARMHYLVTGSGPPVILIHGIIGSAFSWRRNMRPLAHDATVYAIDMLGLGQSDRVPGLDASMSATAERVIAFMDALHLETADVVGTSHGGAIAILLAARYPERVGKLVLVAPANPYSDLSDAIIRFYRTALGKWFVLQVPFLPEPVQDIALGRMYGDPARVPPGTLANYVSALQIPGTAQHVMNILNCWFEDMQQVSEALPMLEDKPVLLLWGDKDRAVSLSSAHKLNGVLRRSELTVLEGAGHLPYEEMPGEVNCRLREWLAPPYRRGEANGKVARSKRDLRLSNLRLVHGEGD